MAAAAEYQIDRGALGRLAGNQSDPLLICGVSVLVPGL
jgi:hypothetical protein